MFLKFRTKLLLAMMFLVGTVTAATLFATRERVQRAYEHMFEEHAMAQFDLFKRARTNRLQSVRIRCSLLANNVRLRQILRTRINPAAESGERDAEAEEILYQTAEDELRDLRGSTELNGGLLSAKFFRFLDANGNVVRPPRGVDVGLRRPREIQERLEKNLLLLHPALTNLLPQQIGYLPYFASNGEKELAEVIFTQCIDHVSGDLLGALVIGFPVPLDPAGIGQIQSGIWQEGKIYSAALAAAAELSLAERITPAIQRGATKGDFSVQVQGDPCQVSYRGLSEGGDFPPTYQVLLGSKAEALKEQARLQLKILSFGIASMAVAFVFSILLSHSLTDSIRALVGGTREIQQGNFQYRVAVASRDEIGQLADSFNEMAKGLADKEYYRSVLDKVADPAVAAELAGGRIALGGETREISVLFCDIRGFTKLTENMPPAEVIQMLNEHFTPLTRVVDECHGMVDKFVGDLIMAVFGAPKSYGDDARNAARCALRMIEERTKLNQTSQYKIEVGIGVASGSAVAGNMGSDRRLNYTVLGERVNLAARLCSKAGRMQVVIDQTTRGHIGARANVEEMAPLELKGFSAPVPAYILREFNSSDVT